MLRSSGTFLRNVGTYLPAHCGVTLCYWPPLNLRMLGVCLGLLRFGALVRSSPRQFLNEGLKQFFFFILTLVCNILCVDSSIS
jgi:hypothetical protein